MLELFARLDTIDQILVIGFVMFAIYIICAIAYVQRVIWGNNLTQALKSFNSNLEAVMKRIDKEEFNSEWMDASKVRNRQRL